MQLPPYPAVKSVISDFVDEGSHLTSRGVNASPITPRRTLPWPTTDHQFTQQFIYINSVPTIEKDSNQYYTQDIYWDTFEKFILKVNESWQRHTLKLVHGRGCGVHRQSTQYFDTKPGAYLYLNVFYFFSKNFVVWKHIFLILEHRLTIFVWSSPLWIHITFVVMRVHFEKKSRCICNQKTLKKIHISKVFQKLIRHSDNCTRINTSATEVREQTLVFLETKSAPQNDQNMSSNYKLLRSHDKIYHNKDIFQNFMSKHGKLLWDMLIFKSADFTSASASGY